MNLPEGLTITRDAYGVPSVGAETETLDQLEPWSRHRLLPMRRERRP
jgi:hypothetical protein